MRTLRPGYVADKQEVLAAIGDASICTVNALRPEQHAGTGGTTYGRLGHIAGSINIAAVHNVDADNCFKTRGGTAHAVRTRAGQAAVSSPTVAAGLPLPALPWC